MEDLIELSNNYIEVLNRPYIRDFVKEDPFAARMTILLGQRGIGKTTSIIQYLISKYDGKLSSKGVLYLPVDHIQIGKRTLYEIAKLFRQLNGKIICFDEIHKYSNWSMELKSIRDTFPDLKIIASGSSTLEVQKGSHDLSRRAIVKYIGGYSFREYLEVITKMSFKKFSLEEILENHEEIARSITKQLQEALQLRILSIFQDYIRKGYYPYFIECSSEKEFFLTLEQSVHSSIEGDIQSVYPEITGVSIKKIIRLFGLIAQQVPFKPKLNKLTEILELSDIRTLKNYLYYLEKAKLVNIVSKVGKGLSIIEKPEKIFLDNTNQVFAFGNQNSNVGNIRETFFINSVSNVYNVVYSLSGDFCVEKYTFEIGGPNKKYNQIKDIKNSFLVIDDIEIGINNKIPLWLFGFLY